MKNFGALLIFLFIVFALVFVAGLRAADSDDHLMEDRDFDRFISAKMLEEAAHSEEVLTIVLAAKELAKGEDELKRPHKSGLTSQELFITAYQTNAQTGNDEVGAGIRTAVRQSHRLDVIPEFNTIDRLIKKGKHENGTKVATPAERFSTNGDKPMDEVVQAIIKSAQSAMVRHDKEAIDVLLKQVNEQDLSLSPKVKIEVTDYLAELKSRLGNSPPAATPNNQVGPTFRSGGASYFSPIFRAAFSLEGGGARVESIEPYSPLWGRVAPGELIVRLDGMRVYSYYEFERHYGPTAVSLYSADGFYRETMVYLEGYHAPWPGPLPRPWPVPIPVPWPDPIPGPMPGPIPRPDPEPMPGPIPRPEPEPMPASE